MGYDCFYLCIYYTYIAGYKIVFTYYDKGGWIFTSIDKDTAYEEKYVPTVEITDDDIIKIIDTSGDINKVLPESTFTVKSKNTDVINGVILISNKAVENKGKKRYNNER